MGWVGSGFFPFSLSSLPWLGRGIEEKVDALVIGRDHFKCPWYGPSVGQVRGVKEIFCICLMWGFFVLFFCCSFFVLVLCVFLFFRCCLFAVRCRNICGLSVGFFFF